MSEGVVYILLKQNVVVDTDTVQIGDVATIFCTDLRAVQNIKKCKLFQFKQEERCVISILKIIEELEKQQLGLTIENLGVTDVIVKKRALRNKEGKYQNLKCFLVCCICFFGSAFTIMAFHNDIGITGVFERIHYLITGEQTNFHSVLELSYGLGLGLGIIVFYNHLGKRKLEKDPTPLVVEMRAYEKDVEQAVIEEAEREGKKIEVDQ